jgi:hypothetical protein
MPRGHIALVLGTRTEVIELEAIQAPDDRADAVNTGQQRIAQRVCSRSSNSAREHRHGQH